MPKLVLTLMLAFATLFSWGQITTTKVAEKKEDIPEKYDSLSNFLGMNVNLYLGQELYLNGKAESLRKYGYDGFYTDYNKSKFDGGVYKCCDSYNSKYDELTGKYFKVLEIIKHPKATEADYLYGKKFYLKLQEKLSNDIVYYEYDAQFKHSFPFIVVGYFEKLKKQAVGKKFVFGSTDKRFGDDELDVKSGKTIKFELGEKWECIDLTIEEKYYTLSLLLKDDDGQTMAVGSEWVIGADKFHDVYVDGEADLYKTKFGADTWNTILEGKVRIGMTKEMCKLSWGEPDKINRTITSGGKSEQWVYDKNYLYFDGDKLTAIQ